jgi:hypothetical protein
MFLEALLFSCLFVLCFLHCTFYPGILCFKDTNDQLAQKIGLNEVNMVLSLSVKAKKDNIEGNYIAFPARVASILQLCLAFTTLIWITSSPFVNEYFSIHADILLYQTVTGEHGGPNADYFKALPEDKRRLLLYNYNKLLNSPAHTLPENASRIIQSLFGGPSPFKIAWVGLAIVIPIFVLKRREGARAVVWLLPILAICHAIVSGGPSEKSGSRSVVIPEEELIVTKYLHEPLRGTIGQQREQLTLGWHRYLVQEWAHEEIAADPLLFQEQVNRGEFAFNLGRAEELGKREKGLEHGDGRDSPLLLLAYIMWNCVFACVVFLCQVRY